jgi:hypothetical protein
MAYTTISLVKSYLGIPSAEASQDTELTAAVNAATETVNGVCNTDFESTSEARVFRPADPSVVYVDQFNTLTGLVVKTDTSNDGTFDTTLTITTDFVVEPFNTAPFTMLRNVSGTWPMYTSNRATVQVTAAYGDQVSTGVPYAIQQAALMLAARYYQRRSSPLGITTGFQDWGPMRISRQDPDVAALLQQYKVLSTA